MPGINNFQALKRKRPYYGLKDLSSISIVDTTPTSDQFFNIVDFPEKLKAGKNLFKIKANAGTLVDNSRIHVEILDYNGQPIYYEIISYAEHDGTRVVSIWIYPETPPGNATVFVAGRAAVDPNTGQSIPYSLQYQSPNYRDVPNVLWSRRLTVAPTLKNDSEIIFIKQPKAIIQEVTQPFLQIDNLAGVQLNDTGSGATLRITPLTTQVANTGLVSATGGNQGQTSLGSPALNFGTPLSQQPLVNSVDAQLGIIQAESRPILTFGSVSQLTIQGSGFVLNNNMIGGVLTVVNPNLKIEGVDDNGAGFIGVTLNADNHLIPLSQRSTEPGLVAAAGSNRTDPLSGSIQFIITDVETSTRGKVAQINGFSNSSDNSNGAFNITIGTDSLQPKTIDAIELSSNFTASYFRRPTTVVTEQSQSFAQIEMVDLEPATGDVYKVKTLFKAGGLFGDFIDLGDTILEEFEVLKDDDSVESQLATGVVKNRIGFFTSLEDFETYWSGSGANVSPEVGVNNVFDPGNLISGVRISPDSTFNNTNNRYAYFHLTSSEYHTDLKSDTTYKLSFKGFAVDSPDSTDPNIPLPRIDIYVSSSDKNTIITDDDVYRNDAYIVRSTTTQLLDSVTDSIFQDRSTFGTRIGSVEFNVSQSLNDISFKFQTTRDDTADIFFLIRRGSWTLADISLVAVKETGFTPNVTRINKRIPPTYFNTPLTFKFQFFDFKNTLADMEVFVYPVTFRGENTVITGTNNIVSGSLFLNSFPGGGIELHGGSAFIRSVGYKGFTSASAGKGAPGFLLYSGSTLPDSGDNYTGTGFEVYVTSSAFISARTDTNELNIKANRIDVGTFTATTSSVALPAGTSGGMLSSSFSTTLLFDANRIMATSSNSPVSMSMTTNLKFLTLGNVIMTDISASALHLTASQFKVLNGTFDASKRNYVYYHYIGNDTALVTINQEQ
jgi:hypothetical protein